MYIIVAWKLLSIWPYSLPFPGLRDHIMKDISVDIYLPVCTYIVQRILHNLLKENIALATPFNQHEFSFPFNHCFILDRIVSTEIMRFVIKFPPKSIMNFNLEKTKSNSNMIPEICRQTRDWNQSEDPLSSCYHHYDVFNTYKAY